MSKDEFEEPKREKTREETDKKCPNCGGTLDFDPIAGDMRCPFCEAHFPIPEKTEEKGKNEAKNPGAAAEQNFEDAEFYSNCDWGTQTKTVICKSCGAQSVYDELMLAAECPYCGSNQVMEEKTEKTLAPGGVCTFKLDRDGAAGKFKSWIKKKWFCPKEAKKKASPESFNGIYVPVWTFDADTTSPYTGEFGTEHTYTDSKGNTHTDVTWHRTSGVYNEFINDNLQLATDRYDVNMFKKLLPFNTEENKIYRPEYIAGFISERYSVGLKDAWERAKSAISSILRGSIENDIKNRHNTNEVRSVKFSTTFNNIKYKYLLTPVWISSYVYKGKTYRFMVNGETGKVSGKAPISGWRVFFAILICIAVLILLYLLYQNY